MIIDGDPNDPMWRDFMRSERQYRDAWMAKRIVRIRIEPMPVPWSVYWPAMAWLIGGLLLASLALDAFDSPTTWDYPRPSMEARQ